MTSLDWSHVEDPDLREWLQGLDADAQHRLAGQDVDKLDRARGDSLMGEGIALRPLRVPFPPGWETWTPGGTVPSRSQRGS